MKRFSPSLWIIVTGLFLVTVGLGGSTVMTGHALSAGSSLNTNGSVAVSGDLNASVSTTGQSAPSSGPPQIDSSLAGPPTDLDGDGRYEDVNGNGRSDFNDLVVLFRHFGSDTVRNHTSAYDFNENGRIDFDDIVELFREI